MPLLRNFDKAYHWKEVREFMYSQTLAALEKFDNQHDCGRKCADILIALGHKDVVLIAPRGGGDGGMDITFTTESGGKGLACVTLRKDIEAKFNEDFSKRQAGEFEKYFLFCTAHLTAQQKLKFARYCLDTLQAEFVSQDIEALRGLLDTFASIRERYLGIKDLRLPKLRLGFYENGHIVDEITRPVNASWMWKPLEDFVQTELGEKREELAQMLARADSTIPESEVRKFQVAYEKYIADLKPVLTMQFVEKYMPCCRFELRLVNEGTARATDVSIRIVFPEGSSFMLLDNLNDPIKIEEIVPEEPATPEWAWPPEARWIMKNTLACIPVPTLLNIGSSLSYLQERPTFFAHKKVPYDSSTFPFGKNTLSKDIQNLSHHRQWSIDPLIVYFPPSVKEGVTITYTILAEELLDPIAGELRVLWDGQQAKKEDDDDEMTFFAEE